MPIKRKQVGSTERYNAHTIRALFLGPDCIVEVDGVELQSFYVSAEAAKNGGRRYCDTKDKEERLDE